MFKLFFFTSIYLCFYGWSTTLLAQTSYQVLPEQSTVRWVGKKILGEHHGTIQLASGAFTLNNDKILRGDFTIDATTIRNEDLEGKQKEKLESWLTSEEMFDVAQHPDIYLKLLKATPTESQNQYAVEAEMTIKGTTHPIEFPAALNTQDDSIRVEASFSFDRTRWNLNYEGGFLSGLANGAINDEVEVEVLLKGKSSR